jgi:(hydroxyamino)benzene mutase
MSAADDLQNHGHRLLQIGVLLFLLALLLGLAIPKFPLPRLALSAHLLGIAQGTFLVAIGLLWPKLRFTQSQSRVTHALAIYGCGAAWTANVCGAAWRAGGSMVPMAAGGARGTASQELAIKILLTSAAVSLIALAVMLLWGLRSSIRIRGEGDDASHRGNPL